MNTTTADAASQALTHEVRRYCRGDRAWTDWQPCTAEQAARYEMDDSCRVRPRVCPLPAPHKRPPRAA